MKMLDSDYPVSKQFGRSGWFCLCLCLHRDLFSLGSSFLLLFVLVSLVKTSLTWHTCSRGGRAGGRYAVYIVSINVHLLIFVNKYWLDYNHISSVCWSFATDITSGLLDDHQPKNSNQLYCSCHVSTMLSRSFLGTVANLIWKDTLCDAVNREK